MGNILPSSKAAGAGAGVKNKVLAASATVMGRKLLIMAMQAGGEYEGKAPLGRPFLVTSPEDAGAKAGPGTMAHRLSIAAFRGSKNSVPAYLLLQKEPDSAKAASGEISVEAEDGHGEGAVSLYIGGEPYKIPVSLEDSGEDIAANIAGEINSDKSCPAAAEQNSAIVTLVSKSKGGWGNGITVALNQRITHNETLPEGITITVAQMKGGAGLPDVKNGIETALGSGDSANEENFTAIIHGYGKDAQVLDALSKYSGEGNEHTGLYSRTVSRPFRSIIGDVQEGGEGLQALMAFADTRKADRTSGICARPGSLTHPQEIAAELLGAMEETAGQAAEGSYIGLKLSGVDPGTAARENGRDWATEYANRDMAVRSGISPLIIKDGIAIAQNVVSFYRPSDMPEDSNMYRRMRDIAITQNVLFNIKKTFESEKWAGFTAVKNKSSVTSVRGRERARDADDVKDDLLALINQFMGMGWLYDTAFSIQKLREPQAVQARADGGGFSTDVSLVYSGEGAILDTICYVDAAVAVAL